MKVSDLTPESCSSNRCLWCRECGGEFSANEGDYFGFKNDHVLTCCNKPLVRVTKRTVYVPEYEET